MVLSDDMRRKVWAADQAEAAAVAEFRRLAVEGVEPRVASVLAVAPGAVAAGLRQASCAQQPKPLPRRRHRPPVPLSQPPPEPPGPGPDPASNPPAPDPIRDPPRA